ncbi:hypothetical protein, partial [Clostridium perfringens]|uniref:hypothetical protein n=1 Tax=Clostridium perfringens TaxID=1502 RepID=UPI0039ED5771
IKILSKEIDCNSKLDKLLNDINKVLDLEIICDDIEEIKKLKCEIEEYKFYIREIKGKEVTWNNFDVLKKKLLERYRSSKLLSLIEKNIDQFISGKIQDFDSNDMESILKSDKISKENKYDIIKLYGEDIEINDSLAEIIFDIIEKFLPDEEIKYKLIEDIIRCQFDKEKRIKLIVYQIEFIDKINISNLLSYIDKEYDGLLDLSHKKMYIENTNANRLILGKLKSKKYISTFNPERSRIVVNRRRT